MTPAAARVTRHRHRQRAGRMVVAVEIHAEHAPQAMVTLQLLDEHKSEDREAIGKALSQFIAAWLAGEYDRKS